jgi:hypothetical protein
MNSLQLTRKLNHLVMAGIACMSFAVAMNAQVKTESNIDPRASDEKRQRRSRRGGLRLGQRPGAEER